MAACAPTIGALLLLSALPSTTAPPTAPAKDCFFLHGTGLDPDSAGAPTPTYEDYWGGVVGYTPGCRSHSFNHMNTITQPFDSPTLMSAVCKDLCGGSDPDRSAAGCVIKNKIIFTHSAGNLYLAAALRQGLCSLDTTSSDWYSVQAPALGSELCDKLVSGCRNPSIFTKPLKAAVALFRYCTNSSRDSTESPMYGSLATTYPALVDGGIKDVMMDYVSGSMCGDHPYGVKCNKLLLNASSDVLNASSTSGHSCLLEDAGLLALSKFGFGSDVVSDAMVALDSCKLSLTRRGGKPTPTQYTNDYHSPWYIMHGNHEDGTCANGNGGPTAGDAQPMVARTEPYAGVNATSRASTAQGGELRVDLCAKNTECHPCSWYGQMVQRSLHRTVDLATHNT